MAESVEVGWGRVRGMDPVKVPWADVTGQRPWGATAAGRLARILFG